MKIAENTISSYKTDWKEVTRKVWSGQISAQGSAKCRHGKVGEVIANRMFGFSNSDGSSFDQVGSSCDVPKSVVEKSNLPKKYHHNVEIKTYDIKNRNGILLGDSVRKMKKIKETLVLIVFFYDGSPSNLVSCDIIKIDSNVIPSSTQNAFTKCSAYVKNKSNCIYRTREEVVNVNKKHRTRAFYLNNNSNSKSDSRQIQLVANLSLLTA